MGEKSEMHNHWSQTLGPDATAPANTQRNKQIYTHTEIVKLSKDNVNKLLSSCSYICTWKQKWSFRLYCKKKRFCHRIYSKIQTSKHIVFSHSFMHLQWNPTQISSWTKDTPDFSRRQRFRIVALTYLKTKNLKKTVIYSHSYCDAKWFSMQRALQIVKNIVSASYSTKDASRNCIYVLKLTVVMRTRLYILVNWSMSFSSCLQPKFTESEATKL